MYVDPSPVPLRTLTPSYPLQQNEEIVLQREQVQNPHIYT